MHHLIKLWGDHLESPNKPNILYVLSAFFVCFLSCNS